MKYCKNCGKEIVDEAVICPHCGVPQEKIPEVVDSGSIGWGVLGFCFPLIGLILFLAWNSVKPSSAKKAGIGALIGGCFTLLPGQQHLTFFDNRRTKQDRKESIRV